MKIMIAPDVLLRFPKAQIGYVIAKIDTIIDSTVDEEYSTLSSSLSSLGIEDGRYGEASTIKLWRDVFKTFALPKEHKDARSSVEALTRRVLKNNFRKVLPAIDLYNISSVRTSLPMGGYDLEKIEGDIQISFGDGTSFKGLHLDPITTRSSEVIYRDDKNVLCWLWNYRDAEHSCITSDTKTAIFFIDIADKDRVTMNMESALQDLANTLGRAGASIILSGFVDAESAKEELTTSSEIIRADGAPSLAHQPKEIKFSALTVKEKADTDPSSIYRYITENQYARVRHLIATTEGEIINRSYPSGNPLHVAAVSGQLAMINFIRTSLIELLGEAKADEIWLAAVNYQNSAAGDSPLHTAIRHDKPRIAKFLSENGASLTLRNNEGETPEELQIKKRLRGTFFSSSASSSSSGYERFVFTEQLSDTEGKETPTDSMTKKCK